MRELVAAMVAQDDGHRYRLYARAPSREPPHARVEWLVGRRSGMRWHRAVGADASETCDVFLAGSYLTAPVLRIPAVTVVHDLTAFDLRLRSPARSVLVERTRLAAAVRASRHVLVPSKSTWSALVSRVPAAGTKTSIMPLGVARALAARPRTGAGAPFLLTVGLDPRKNVEMLVEGFHGLPRALRATHRLVAVGPTPWRARRAVRAVRSLGASGLVLGAVDDNALAELYRTCTVFCFPSLAEGFGLPVLEAMAAGAPVLAANRTSLPEVGGEEAVYLPPDDPAAWTAALEALLDSPERRKRLGRAARARAARFTWSRAADIALQAVERAAGLLQPLRAFPRPAEVADQRAQ